MKIKKDNGFICWVVLNKKEQKKLNLNTPFIELDRQNQEINLCYEDFSIFRNSIFKNDDYIEFISNLNKINKRLIVVY